MAVDQILEVVPDVLLEMVMVLMFQYQHRVEVESLEVVQSLYSQAAVVLGEMYFQVVEEVVGQCQLMVVGAEEVEPPEEVVVAA